MKENAKLGCFGISICYSPKSDHCKACRIKESCLDESKREVLKMAEKVDVKDYIRRFRTSKVQKKVVQTGYMERATKLCDEKRQLTRSEIRMLTTMTVKAAAVAKTILSKDIDVQDFVNNRMNPFNKRNLAYLGTTIDALFEGELMKRDLIQLFMSTYGWKKATAHSYANIALEVLVRLDAAQLNWGKYRIKERIA